MSATIEPLGEALTRRELEILALLAQGLSAAEIAAQLTLAVSSAKWHIQQIYRKLGVNNRQKAVVRAGALGLLAASPGETPPRAARARQRGSLAKLGPTLRHNLPLQLTSFIGRAQEIVEVKRLLRANRLLTLIGPGGTGKTRLAQQAAAETLDEFPDGVWLVELAPITELAQVPQAVAQALELHAETADPFEPSPVDASGRDVLLPVVGHLQKKTPLLILDNCEHLVGACAQLAEQLLRAAPGLRILATSREALGVAGEKSYAVPTLSVPDPHQLPPLETLAESEAVRLFVERASAVRSDFALTDENALAVAQICQNLDGIPLAIELAAARVRALSVEQIVARLAKHDRLQLLTGGSRSAPPRQQTLRGAIDWSYELLTAGEQALLRRLSVFTGGWTLEAAEHLISGPDVLDLLTQLVGKSLVLSAQQPKQAARFSMLETIREYARERLFEAGESDLANSQHLAICLALAEEAEPELRGNGQVEWLNRLDRENDNLRGALAWAVKCVEAEAALRLAGALTYYWVIRGYGAEGRRWLEAALDLLTSRDTLGPRAWHARALLGAGWLDREKDLSASQSRLEKATDIYRELGDKSGMAYGLYLLGSHIRVVQKDNTRALGLYQEALELWMAVEDGWGVGNCLHVMGHVADEMGERAKARELYQRSVEILRKEGDRFQFGGPLGDLAWQSWKDGDAARARAVFGETQRNFEELGAQSAIAINASNLVKISIPLGAYAHASAFALTIRNLPGSQRNIAHGRTYLGQIDFLQGRLAEAQAQFEASLAIFRELSDQKGMGWVSAWLGCVAYRAGNLDRAQTLIEEGLAIDDPNGYWPELAFALLSRGDVARAQGDPTTAAEYYARSLRIVLEHQDQPNVAERLEGFAKLASAAQQPQRASRLFGAAESLRQRIGTPIPEVERADYDGAVALARAQHDPAAFNAAWVEGQALGWEQAAAYALER